MRNISAITIFTPKTPSCCFEIHNDWKRFQDSLTVILDLACVTEMLQSLPWSNPRYKESARIWINNICMSLLGKRSQSSFHMRIAFLRHYFFFSLVFESGPGQRQRMQPGLCWFPSEITLCIWWKNFSVPVWVSTSKMQRPSAGNSLPRKLQRWEIKVSLDHNEK